MTKILLIEETEIIRFYFRDAFWLHSEAGAYDIGFANDIRQAQAFLQTAQGAPDIIFLDLVMHGQIKGRNVLAPEVGFTLLQEIRALPKFQDSKIVIFSSPQYFKLWKKAKKLGADFFLKKDQYLPNHLVKWVEQIMSK